MGSCKLQLDPLTALIKINFSYLNKMGNKNAKANAPALRKEDLDALVKSSGMTEQEVQAYFNNFVKEHKNGKITKQDFGPMMPSWRFMSSRFMMQITMVLLTSKNFWLFFTWP